jgi:hypothetical protein
MAALALRGLLFQHVDIDSSTDDAAYIPAGRLTAIISSLSAFTGPVSGLHRIIKQRQFLHFLSPTDHTMFNVGVVRAILLAISVVLFDSEWDGILASLQQHIHEHRTQHDLVPIAAANAELAIVVADASFGDDGPHSEHLRLLDSVMHGSLSHDAMQMHLVRYMQGNATLQSQLESVKSQLVATQRHRGYWKNCAASLRLELFRNLESNRSQEWKPGRYFNLRGAVQACLRRGVGVGIGADAVLDICGVDASRQSLTFWEHKVAAALCASTRAFLLGQRSALASCESFGPLPNYLDPPTGFDSIHFWLCRFNIQLTFCDFDLSCLRSNLWPHE